MKLFTIIILLLLLFLHYYYCRYLFVKAHFTHLSLFFSLYYVFYCITLKWCGYVLYIFIYICLHVVQAPASDVSDVRIGAFLWKYFFELKFITSRATVVPQFKCLMIILLPKEG